MASHSVREVYVKVIGENRVVYRVAIPTNGNIRNLKEAVHHELQAGLTTGAERLALWKVSERSLEAE